MVAFSVILEKRSRGRGLGMVSKSWTIRTFKLEGQQLKYFDGDKEKGTISIKKAMISEIQPSDADMKEYAFMIETSNKEKVYLNASNNDIRQKCMNILNISASNPKWNDQIEIGRINVLSKESTAMFTEGLANLQIQVGKHANKQTLKEKVNHLSFQGLSARSRFKKALINGVIDVLMNSAVEMIQLAWRLKAAKLKLQSYRNNKKYVYAVKIQSSYRIRLAKRKLVKFKSIQSIQRLVRSFLAFLRYRRVTALYPELLQLRIHTIYRTTYCNSNSTNKQMLKQHAIAFISGVSLKNKTTLSSLSNNNNNNNNRVSNKILDFQKAIKSQGEITSTYHNNRNIENNKHTNSTYTTTDYNSVVTSTKQLDAIVITIVDQRSSAFLGQTIVNANKLNIQSGHESIDLKLPLTNLSIEDIKNRNNRILLNKNYDPTGSVIMLNIKRPLQSYNICGYFWKASGSFMHLNEWRKRYFVLLDGKLYCYNNEYQLHKPKFMILSQNIISITHDKTTFRGRKSLLMLHSKGNWRLSFDESISEQLKNKWMRIFQNNCK